MTEEEMEKAVKEYKESSFLARVFAIHPLEQRRFILFGCMFCMIAFAYAFLRVFKDRVVYSVLDNTETKNWLKLLTFVVTQILVIFCQNISSRTDFNNAFRILMMSFTGLLGANAIAIVFNKHILHLQPDDIYFDKVFVSGKYAVRGIGWLYPLSIVIGQYIFSFFYILAEVIGSMAVSFCFMTFVNNNTYSAQNKRFVRSLLFFSNLSSCLAGVAYNFWNGFYREKPKAASDIYYFIFPGMVIAMFGLVLFVKKILEKELTNVLVVPSGAATKTGGKKKKIGLRDSIYLMVQSKFLMSMCALSFFYNFSTNILETANAGGMSASASALDKERSFYAVGFKSFDLIGTSIATSLIVISPISHLPERFGIAPFACIPLIVSGASALVTLAISLRNFPATGYDNMWPFDGYNPTTKYFRLESYIGTGIQSLMKIAKYAFFDIIKEILAMAIDPSIRPLFKGVFDGSITKLSKCLGSLYGILMTSLTGMYSDSRFYFPVSTAVIIGFCVIWVFPIRYLSRSYAKAKSAKAFMDPGIPLSDIKI